MPQSEDLDHTDQTKNHNQNKTKKPTTIKDAQKKTQQRKHKKKQQKKKKTTKVEKLGSTEPPSDNSTSDDDPYTWERELESSEALAAAEMRLEESQAMRRWLFEMEEEEEEEEQREEDRLLSELKDEEKEKEEEQEGNDDVAGLDDDDDATPPPTDLPSTCIDEESEEDTWDQDEDAHYMGSAFNGGPFSVLCCFGWFSGILMHLHFLASGLGMLCILKGPPSRGFSFLFLFKALFL